MVAPTLMEALRPRTRRLGVVLVHVAETPSTMDEARRAAETGQPHGFVVVADRQTWGVGRQARSWHSPRGGLYFSLVLRPDWSPAKAGWASLVAALAVREALSRFVPRVLRLRWPNDVMAGQRKIAGVLPEARWLDAARPEWVVVGVGVNANSAASAFPDSLQGSVATVRDLVTHPVPLSRLLARTLESMERWFAALDKGVEQVAAAARGGVATIGRRVIVRTEESTIKGRAVDLGPRGELVVQTETGRKVISTGECRHLAEASGPSA